jgi:hypothetical protein
LLFYVSSRQKKGDPYDERKLREDFQAASGTRALLDDLRIDQADRVRKARS